MRTHIKAGLCAGVTLTALSAAPASAELVTNGDFEAGLTGFHNYNVGSELGTHKYGPPSYGSTLPTGWSKAGSRIWTVTDNGAADAFSAANGDWAVRLDAATNGGEDKLLQSGISLTAGETYDFSIDMWSESAGSDLTVQLTGPATVAVLTGYVDAVAGVETVTASFTPTVTGSYTLEVFNPDQTTASNGNHTWVDNVSITVPEPASAALAGLGLLLVGGRRRR